jgi:threonine synthase
MINNLDEYNKWQAMQVAPIVSQLNEITGVFDALMREEDMPAQRMMFLVSAAWKQYDKVINADGYAMWCNHSEVIAARENLYNTHLSLMSLVCCDDYKNKQVWA